MALQRRFLATAVVAVPVLLLAELTADEPAAGPPDSAGAPVSLNGVVEPLTVHQLRSATKQLGALRVSRVVAHGTAVNRGQNLVWLESEDLDGKLAAAEAALQEARLQVGVDEFAHTHALKVAEVERKKAGRVRQLARQAFQNFMKIDRDRDLRAAEFDVIQARAAVENATEELDQLRQMYEEDDLTEESEEIVLKRAVQAVKNAAFRLEGVEIASSRKIDQTIPNAEAGHRETLALAELAYEKRLRDLRDGRRRRELELIRSRRAVAAAERTFAELKAERQRLVLRSPIDGIAIHGKLTRGRLGDKPSSLVSGSTVSPDQVIMTVVGRDRLQIRVDLEGKDLAAVQEGGSCTIAAAAVPGWSASGRIASVAAVPYAGQKYDCVVTLTARPQGLPLRPLMACDVAFDRNAKPRAKKAPAKKAPAKKAKP